MKRTIKLTYQMGGKSSSIEKSVKANSIDEAHEIVYQLFLKWFKYQAKDEIALEVPERQAKRQAFENEYLQSKKQQYEKIKFLEDE